MSILDDSELFPGKNSIKILQFCNMSSKSKTVNAATLSSVAFVYPDILNYYLDIFRNPAFSS